MNSPKLLATFSARVLLAALVVCEVTLSCAIVANIVFVEWRRIERMATRTGLEEDHLLVIGVSDLEPQPPAVTRQDLDALRRLPGVTHAAAISQVPFGFKSSSAMIRATMSPEAAGTEVSIYSGSPGVLQAMGLHLISGRDFVATEYSDPKDAGDAASQIPAAAVVTADVARRLFRERSALGKPLYMGTQGPINIVGVVDALAQPYLRNPATIHLSILVPRTPEPSPVRFYLVRTQGADVAALADSARRTLGELAGRRIIPLSASLSDLRDRFFQRERSANMVLSVAVVVTLIVLVIGTHGMARFSVVKRQSEIGIRRAIGGAVGQLLAMFQREHLVVTLLGSLMGIPGALLVNVFLVRNYGAERLPLLYAIGTAVGTMAISQVSILLPTWRASTVPPAVATRGAQLSL